MDVLTRYLSIHRHATPKFKFCIKKKKPYLSTVSLLFTTDITIKENTMGEFLE